MEIHRVYGILDPRDLLIKYIGKTSNSLADRLYNHIWTSKKSNKTKKEKWLVKLVRLNLSPTIVPLFEGTEEQATLKEIELIGRYWDSLKNTQPGGEGQPKGFKFKNIHSFKKGDPTHIERCKRMWDNPEYKEKMRAVARANRGKKRPYKPRPRLNKRTKLIHSITNEIKEFESITEASIFLSCTVSSIGSAVKNNGVVGLWQPRQDEINTFIPNKGTKRLITIIFDNGADFTAYSIKEAAETLEIDRRKVYSVLKTGDRIKGAHVYEFKAEPFVNFKISAMSDLL